MKRPKPALISLLLALLVCGGLYRNRDQIPGLDDFLLRARGKATTASRLAEYGPGIRPGWEALFARQNLQYPPQSLTLVGLKRERRLEVYTPSGTGMKAVKSFPILAASGGPGPKLSYGDGQVPEGIYRVESLNPNSAYHLALRLNFPNDFDREMARRDGRGDPGRDIMIHGSRVSIGCLAVGNPAIEELFVLAADTGIANIRVLMCPQDLRESSQPPLPSHPPWTQLLYRELKRELQRLPTPMSRGVAPPVPGQPGPNGDRPGKA